MKNPYMPFWVNDYRNSRAVRLMTFEQKGLYIDMIVELWADEYLPDDYGKLAKLFGTNPKTFKRIFEKIKERFEFNQEKITHKKVDEERGKMIAEATRKSETNRDNAIKGWEKRRARNATADATANDSQCDTDTYSYTDTLEGVEGEPPDDLINNCSKPVDNFDVTIVSRVLPEYCKYIKFAASNHRNHYFIETAVKSDVSEADLISAIRKVGEFYKNNSTPEQFRKGVEAFFAVDHIRHALSVEFTTEPTRRAHKSDLTEGQQWLKDELSKNYDVDGGADQTKVSRKDALSLIESYLEVWRYGLKPKLAARWLDSLIGRDLYSVAKAFDDLIKSSEKPFNFKKLTDLAENHVSKSGTLDEINKWRANCQKEAGA